MIIYTVRPFPEKTCVYNYIVLLENRVKPLQSQKLSLLAFIKPQNTIDSIPSIIMRNTFSQEKHFERDK